MFTRLLLLLLLFRPAFAQYPFTNGIKPSITTVGGLPTAAAGNKGVIFTVSDGASTSDCTSGSGSTQVTCISNGSAWTALGGGSQWTTSGSNISYNAGNVSIGTTIPGGAPSPGLYSAVFDHAGQVYNVFAYGVVAGDVDTAGANSTAMLALLATVNTAGGGTIYFPPGTYRFDSQLLLPNDGASPQQNQNNIRITAAGGGAAWYSTDAAVLDLRYVSGNQNAKIETRGRGTLVIDHLTIEDGSASNVTPLVHTTNTTLLFDSNTFILSGNVTQDAIVLGGTSTTVSTGVNSPFQGYRTRITNNHFRNGNRGVYGLTYANEVLIQGNSFQGNTGTVAIEFDGSNGGGQPDYGNSILDNTIEMDVYTYAIKGTLFKESVMAGNGMNDPGANVSAYYNFNSTSTQNKIYCGTSPVSKTFLSGDAASIAATTIVCSESGMNDSSGNGLASNELAYNATVKGTYDSTKVYTGALNIASKDTPTEVVSIGFDHTNTYGVLTTKINTTVEPLAIRATFTGVGPVAYTPTHTLDVFNATATTGSTSLYVKAGAGQAAGGFVTFQFNGVNDFIQLSNVGTLSGNTNGVGVVYQLITDYGSNSGASFRMGSTGYLGFNSTAGLGSGAIDLSLSRDAAGVLDIGSGAQGSSAGSWKSTNGTISGSLSYSLVSSGVVYKAGLNARTGAGTLSGGTLAVANTSVTANSQVFVQDTSSGSLVNVGSLVVSSQTAGVGFTVTSTNALDASTFRYWIFETN